MIVILSILVVLETLALLTIWYKKSQKKYDGTMEVALVGDPDEGGKQFRLAFDEEPYDLDKRKVVVLEVKKVSSLS